MIETWRPVVGFEDRYEVSDLGRVRSLMDNHGARKTPLILTSFKHKDSGYHQVNLKIKGKVHRRYDAHLVLEAFVGPRPEGLEACHNNGNKSDNALGNLRWDTHSSNLADKHAHGTAQIGSLNAATKLDESRVKAIKDGLPRKETCSSLAKKFGVSDGAIYKIRDGKTWSHL